MPLISRLMPVPHVLKANNNKKLYLYAFYGATTGEPPLLIPSIFANKRTGATLPGRRYILAPDVQTKRRSLENRCHTRALLRRCFTNEEAI